MFASILIPVFVFNFSAGAFTGASIAVGLKPEKQR